MGRNAAEVIRAQSRDDMLAKAKKYIDRLLPKCSGRASSTGKATATRRT
jgi:hypothetical protein